jgi:hypothetical protein
MVRSGRGGTWQHHQRALGLRFWRALALPCVDRRLQPVVGLLVQDKLLQSVARLVSSGGNAVEVVVVVVAALAESVDFFSPPPSPPRSR